MRVGRGGAVSSKAGYATTQVACGWTWAVIKKARYLGRNCLVHTIKKVNQAFVDVLYLCRQRPFTPSDEHTKLAMINSCVHANDNHAVAKINNRNGGKRWRGNRGKIFLH